jgi:type II secretory pathway pseudopilin PulG
MRVSPAAVFALGGSLAVGVAVVAAFLVIGSPAQIRATRLDGQRVTNLQALIDAIAEDRRRGDPLPDSLAQLINRPTHSYMRILDPETRQPYDYRVLDPDRFELCAQFATVAKDPDRPDSLLRNHGSGHQCIVSEAKPRN